MNTLKRIDELLEETAWLNRKWLQSGEFWQDRITHRLCAIAAELRAINQDTDRPMWFAGYPVQAVAA